MSTANAIPRGYRLMATLVVFLVPVWLVLTSVRLLMTGVYLDVEYAKSDFPADPYGFTQAERRAYAQYAIDYMVYNADVSYLGDLELPDGMPMYNERELQHMVDVQAVTQAAFVVYAGVCIYLVAAGIILLRGLTTRRLFTSAIRQGGYLTLALIATLVLLAILSWDFFFELFHSTFFEAGTWRFYYSDTLIRLFPEQFWFDAALAIGLMTAVGAILCIVVVSVLHRRADRALATGPAA